MARTRKRSTTSLVAFRLADDLVERIDKVAERWSRERPGLIINRTDAARMLLERALVDEEKG
jgi:predicted transcriptional regulator